MRYMLKTGLAVGLMMVFCAAPVCDVLAQEVSPVQKKSETTYKTPYLEGMVDLLFSNGFVDPNDAEQLRDYVLVKDCDLFKRYFTDDFMWNKIRNRIIADSKTLQNHVDNRYVLDVRFWVTRYNFNTKAFDIRPDSQLDNVNLLTLYTASNGVACSKAKGIERFNKLPSQYQLRLDTPLSLYRIPMAENMGRKILAAMDKTKLPNEAHRILYGMVYLTVDSVMGTDGNQAVLLGRVDKLEFYLDQARTRRIRTLYYSDL